MTGVLDYQKRLYLETAALMAAAGLPIVLQFGEFTWWYFALNGGMAYYDDTTRTAALGALGRELHVFTGPDDDPAVNGYADANFLRGRLVAHCAAIRAYVRATYPSSQFEILLPLDVNYPAPYGRYSLGGALNYYVNIPDEFRDPALAPFDRVKMEGLDFGAGSRDLNRAVRCMQFPYAEGSWPRASCAYLIAVFNGGCPWPSELLAALGEGLVVNFWAFDHLCILGWSVDPPVDARQVTG
jgi:hypothetical protein